MTGLKIVKAGAERIVELEPLWKSMHAQHRSVDPGLRGIPMRTARDSWVRRRRAYRGWLAEKDTLLLMAEHHGRPVGYALARMQQASEGWDTGGRFAALESLAVLPEMRSRGVGRRLMSALYAALRRRGVAVLGIAVLATNARARRFYERKGFAPWLVQYLGTIPGSGGRRPPE